ncbi:MAG: MoaD/ThiS family protein [Tissierellia bacterium]|nr:MoaD/ThiS family protein [Tissierellia bacterium]
MVEVRLFAYFRNGREKISHLAVDDFSSPRKILEHLEIDEEELGILLINGFHSQLDDQLKDGDVLAIFPPVAGG